MGSRTSRRAKEQGKRSGLEVTVGQYAQKQGFKYEEVKLPYVVPETKRSYLPDFTKGNIVIEAKGRFTAADRAKMLLVRDQHPDKIILMVFGRAKNTLSKRSKTTYGDWCTKNNLSWVDVETYKKDNKTICQLLTMKQMIFGNLPMLPKKKKHP